MTMRRRMNNRKNGEIPLKCLIVLGVFLLLVLGVACCKKDMCRCLDVESGSYVAVDLPEHPTSTSCGNLNGQFLTECVTEN